MLTKECRKQAMFKIGGARQLVIRDCPHTCGYACVELYLFRDSNNNGRRSLMLIATHADMRITITIQSGKVVVVVVVVVVTFFNHNFVNCKAILISEIKNLRNKIQYKPK